MDHPSGAHLPILAQEEDIGTLLHVHESVGGVAVAAASRVDQDPGMPERLGEQESDTVEPKDKPL